mmetsp:Transcript_5080/g.7615  ORF Transcript_5080/g.7615 Transcript_5080/m.7615 type:complete len:216 (-) Transcript_5080:58-705(-)
MTSSCASAFSKHRIVLEFLEDCAPNVDWAARITPDDVYNLSARSCPAFVYKLLTQHREHGATFGQAAHFNLARVSEHCFTLDIGDLSPWEQGEYTYERGERQKIELKKLKNLSKKMKEGIRNYNETGVLPPDVITAVMACDYCGTEHDQKPCPKRKREREEREIEHQRLEKELQQAYARSEEHRLKFIREQEERRGVHDEPAPARLKRLRQEWGM